MAILRCGPWYEFTGSLISGLTPVGPSDPVDPETGSTYIQPVNAAWSESDTWPFQWRNTTSVYLSEGDFETTMDLQDGVPTSYSGSNSQFIGRVIYFAYQAVSDVTLSITYDCSVTTGDTRTFDMATAVEYNIDGEVTTIAEDIDEDGSDVAISGTDSITLPATTVPKFAYISVSALFFGDSEIGSPAEASISYDISLA